MELCTSHRGSQFSLEGKFLGFIREDHKIKYFRVAVAANELIVKLPKNSREKLYQILMPGDWIQVSGESKLKEGGQLKLKAALVKKVAVHLEETLPETGGALPCQKKAKIRVCQGSGCRKQGGKKLLSCIQSALSELGLQNHVTIEQTGCVKRCSSAPNVVFPGKNRCGKIRPDAISQLLEQHFLDPQSSGCSQSFCNL